LSKTSHSSISSTSSHSSSHTSSSHSSSTSTTSTGSLSTKILNTNLGTPTATPNLTPVAQKFGSLGVGGVAAVSISAVGAVAVAAFALLFFFRRRSQRSRPASMYPQEAYLYDPPIQSGEVGAPWIETTEYRGANGGSVYGVEGQALLPPLPRGPPAQTQAESEAEGLLGTHPRPISHAPEMPPPMTGASFRSMLMGEPAYTQAPSTELEEGDLGQHESAVVSPFQDEEEHNTASTAFEPGAFNRTHDDTGTS
jgi:hypothetical protein